ncbi:MAG TPA: anti-sigma factor [Candidatus Baltobacteraceae bacterium]|nr:anti-sigma factor [Candidatus Baltobacteraceae bacterium]
MTHDDALLDAVALLALGVLPAAEAAEVRAHVAACEACRREYRELRPAADAVGYAAEAAANDITELRSARMRSRVLREIQDDLAGRGKAPATVRREQPWLAYIAAAAALVLAILSSVNNATLRSENEANQERIATLQRELAAQTKETASARSQAAASDARIAALLAPGSRRYDVAAGEVVKSGGRIYLALHLPAPPRGKVFQAWTLSKGRTAMSPSITFKPDEHGSAIVELPEGAANLTAVAVSLEPEGGSKAPTSTPAFVQKLT